jgi:4-diphosphocytidyl-2-C-methyl-D-erythritol kinase
LSQSVKAYAKINLHLQVLNRRNDGFHNIFSLMSQVGLFDLLKLESANISNDAGSEVKVEIISAGGSQRDLADSIPAEENLITKAVKKYCQALGLSGEFLFSLEKNIPAGAGLGGGSSDAASALRLVSGFTGLGQDRLMEIASRVGADVPFLLSGGSAICEGIGEIVESLKGGLNYHVVLANNGIHVDTAQAYSMLNRSSVQSVTGAEITEMKKAMRSSFHSGRLDGMSRYLVNDFEPVVFAMHPLLAGLKRSLLDTGADFAAMTGSGSTLIGLFSSEKMAAEAANCLKDSIRHVTLTSFLQIRHF